VCDLHPIDDSTIQRRFPFIDSIAIEVTEFHSPTLRQIARKCPFERPSGYGFPAQYRIHNRIENEQDLEEPKGLGIAFLLEIRSPKQEKNEKDPIEQA